LFQSRSLATAVSLVPQFLLCANMPQYKTGSPVSQIHIGLFLSVEVPLSSPENVYRTRRGLSEHVGRN
jgi:hypothetical protein